MRHPGLALSHQACPLEFGLVRGALHESFSCRSWNVTWASCPQGYQNRRTPSPLFRHTAPTTRPPFALGEPHNLVPNHPLRFLVAFDGFGGWMFIQPTKLFPLLAGDQITESPVLFGQQPKGLQSVGLRVCNRWVWGFEKDPTTGVRFRRTKQNGYGSKKLY